MMLDATKARRGKYTNIERIYKTINAGPYDALLMMSPESVPYFTGFFNFDIRQLIERFHFVIWPKDNDPTLVVIDRRKNAFTPGDTFITDIVDYQGEGLDSIRVVAEVLGSKGIKSGRIGIEGRNFPGGHLLELQRRLPDLRFEDALSFIEGIRAVKTPSEVELIARLAKMTTEAIDTAFREAKPGDTERAIASRMCYELLKRGAEEINFCFLGSGERSGRFHGVATDAPVPSGTLVKTDFGGILDGYISDVAREVVIGKATPYQRDMHAKVMEVNRRIVSSVRPSMTAAEVSRIGRDAYRDLKMDYKWAILGHGLGLGTHETPQLYPWVDDPILEGMTMMIETGYNDYPNQSFHVEDLILITDRGAKYLTDASSHDRLWEIGVNA